MHDGSGAVAPARGLWVHASVAFTEGRRPLGVSGLEVWARPEEKPTDGREKESWRWLRGFEQGADLGKACPGTRVIVVGDGESDIYELLELQAARSEEAGLLVRANAGRRRRAAVQVMGRTTIKSLAEQAGRCPLVVRCRKVAIDLRVQLQPPASRPGSRPLEVLAVQVRETGPSRGQKPLEWLLVSSDGEPTKRDALRIVQRYGSRWGIEEYFRVLKSGMRIQDRRLRTGAGLAKCLAFDAIQAWRVFQLDRYAPDTPASAVLTAQERYVIDTLASWATRSCGARGWTCNGRCAFCRRRPRARRACKPHSAAVAEPAAARSTGSGRPPASAGATVTPRTEAARPVQLDARGHWRPGTPCSSVERPFSSGVVRPRTGDTMSGESLRLPARSNRPQAQQ